MILPIFESSCGVRTHSEHRRDVKGVVLLISCSGLLPLGHGILDTVKQHLMTV